MTTRGYASRRTGRSCSAMGGRSSGSRPLTGCWYRTLDLDAGIRSVRLGARRDPLLARLLQPEGRRSPHRRRSSSPACTPPPSRSTTSCAKVYDHDQDDHRRGPRDVDRRSRSSRFASAFEYVHEERHLARLSLAQAARGRRQAPRQRDASTGTACRAASTAAGRPRFVRFSRANNGKPAPLVPLQPRPGGPAATREQTRYCSDDYRLLLPLWRTEPLYLELKQSHDILRGCARLVARPLRRRRRPATRVASRSAASAPTGCARTPPRAIEWLRICFREGWLGTPRRNHGVPQRPRDRERASRLATR